MNLLLTVVAIIAGPILAIQVQKFIERVTQKKFAKETIFKVLMSTRGTQLLPEHVRALNMIDIEFFGKKKKDQKVIAAWRIYLDELYGCPGDQQATDYKTRLDAWTQKSSELFNDMLFEMAAALGYNFDKVLLKRGAYTPIGYGEADLDHYTIRKSLVDFCLNLKVFKSIPIRVVEPPPVEAKEKSL